MKRVEAPCPSCGAIVEFKVSSSLVTVCEHCQTVVARGDARFEDWGKVARLAPTVSRLYLGAEGTYRSKSFEVVGHVQYAHAGGGYWDEWFAYFSNDRWGWFSEAQGKIYYLVERAVAEGSNFPSRDALVPGEELKIRGLDRLVVAEVGEAKIHAAEGELPFEVHPGESHWYADLAGEDGSFGTIEYDAQDAPSLSLGREVTLKDLDLAPYSGALDAEILAIGALKLDCPNCGGSLDLRAPDKSERVICPFCEGVLDVDQGNLKYLHTLELKRKVAPVIPIGSTGNLYGNDYTVIGFMQRSVTYDRDYFWTEYLLYNSDIGFRWLVHSDNHWSFVEPGNIGDLKYSVYSSTAEYQKEDFKLFQSAVATVRYVIGEFYWLVAVGERVETRDYISPPKMLSVEKSILGKQSNKGDAAEVQLSVATYLEYEVLEQAFQLKPLPRGWGIAPNQPKPFKLAPVWLTWLISTTMLIMGQCVAGMIRGPKADVEWMWVGLVALAVLPAIMLYYRHNFEVRRWQDSDYSPYSTE